MLKRLWNDETGALLSAELVIVMTLLMCAMIVGVGALRDAIVTELADVGAAIGAFNQSYSIGGVASPHALQPGSQFHDGLDSDDTNGAPGQAGNSRGVVVCSVVAVPECTAPVAP
jgi:Flp pilus assembly pilin Flp